MSFHKEYLTHQKYYEKKYNKARVLMQNGSFFEMFSLDHNELKEISNLLNIVLTKRNKKIDKVSLSNPYLMGFNCISLPKFLRIFIENDYTIVLVEQVTPPPNPKRKVTKIISKGTYIDEAFSPDSNNIVSLYIEDEIQMSGKVLMCVGMSVVDLTTGNTCIHETLSMIGDEKFALDEATRFIHSYTPKEIIIYRKKLDKNKEKLCMNKNAIVLYLEIESKLFHYHTKLEKNHEKISFLNELLKKVYSDTGMLSPLEYLELEKKPYAAISFVSLLSYAYQHNENIVNNLYYPTFFQDNKHLVLGNNAIFQLNVFTNHTIDLYNKQFKSLFDVVNNTSTALGRRYLKSTLATPFISHKKLKLRYDCVETFLENDLYKKLERYLVSVMDVERLHRKLSLSIIHPFQFVNLLDSLTCILKIVKILKKKKKIKKIIPKKKVIKRLNKFISECIEIFNLDEMKKYRIDDITDSFFNIGKYKKIDKYQKIITNNMDFMDSICTVLSQYVTDKGKAKSISNNIKIHLKYNERDGYYLSLTKLRANSLKKNISKLKKIKITNDYKLNPKDLEYKVLAQGNTKIFFDDLKKKSNEIIILRESKLMALVKKKYVKLLKTYHTEYTYVLKKISDFIAIVDYTKSNAKTAAMYNYCKPHIVMKNSEQLNNGYIQCKQLRHPIIERINGGIEYVPHDITLGRDEHYKQDGDALDGMLIYSTNGAGKSSLMKAIGLSIIMAQCGMYVPAIEYNYSPYESLYCRISGNDNLFKGLSSFALEMTELRAILKRSGPKTLVIGDEVCRGTEQTSGTALVAATIITLAETGSSFIFATHLHQIAKMKRIKNLKNVKSFHLTVNYDEKKDILIFDRLLKPGTGPSVYGVTVAKYIIRNDDFLKLTQEIKNEILNIPNKLMSDKTSHYNSKVYVDKCSVCSKSLNKCGYLDTHHINHQKDCENGFVKNKPHVKKNQKANLVILCKKCHHKVHHDELEISGYKDTSNGIILAYKALASPNSKRL
uniref:DNA mismatch repair ATPase n=1 Tax=Mimivirus LCMiAC01 TaxID=2506608 RepID=A0A481Z093_9VIRU|nr:MAG: DNA mismatch repair ATPase [Mimivirus LCMiAC01]